MTIGLGSAERITAATLGRSGWPLSLEPVHPMVKICGITTPELAHKAGDAGADMIGLVHFPPSPRHLDVNAIPEIAAAADASVTKIVLTVDADDQTLDALFNKARPHALQLHGKESPDRVAEIAARYAGTLVLKAVGVAQAADLEHADRYDCLCLLDAKPPKDADRPGGLGATFDWSIIEHSPFDRPYMLSGGLDPANVGEAVRRLRPYAVDVSSGVETGGKKDIEKVAAFIAAAKGA